MNTVPRHRIPAWIVSAALGTLRRSRPIPPRDRREKNAKVGVKYDGEPKFEPIRGTSLSYAVKTDSSVLRHENRFYLCEQAVWYVSVSPKGPWEVATRREALERAGGAEEAAGDRSEEKGLRRSPKPLGIA